MTDNNTDQKQTKKPGKKRLWRRLYEAWRDTDQSDELGLMYDGGYGGYDLMPEALRRNDPKHKKAEAEKLIREFPVDRFSQYPILEEMIRDPINESAVTMHLSHALSAKMETGEIIFIEERDGADKADKKLIKELNQTFAPILNNNLMKWGFLTALYGYYPVRPHGEPGKGITLIRDDWYLNPRFIREYERAGQLAGYTHRHQRQTAQQGMIRLMEPWKFVTFKVQQYMLRTTVEPHRFRPLEFDIERDDYWNEEPIESVNYGTSLMSTAYDPWMDLQEAILSLNVSRRNASKRDRFVGVNVGKMDVIRAAKYYNMLADQFQRKAEESARRSLKDGYVKTINNHIFPIYGSGSGQVNIQTEESPVDVSSIEDVQFHVNRLAAAHGIDKSLLGFTEDLAGGLGEGGFFRMSIAAAIKANQIRRAMIPGIERLFNIHIALKYGKVFTDEDRPYKLTFNSLNTAIQREESEAKESAANYGTAVATLMQMLDPELSRFDFRGSAHHIFTDIMRIDEKTVESMIAKIKEGEATDSGDPNDKIDPKFIPKMSGDGRPLAAANNNDTPSRQQNANHKKKPVMDSLIEKEVGRILREELERF